MVTNDYWCDNRLILIHIPTLKFLKSMKNVLEVLKNWKRLWKRRKNDLKKMLQYYKIKKVRGGKGRREREGESEEEGWD